MEEVKRIDTSALIQIKACFQTKRITKQQYRTLRGQVFAGDGDAAMRGLRKILTRGVANG